MNFTTNGKDAHRNNSTQPNDIYLNTDVISGVLVLVMVLTLIGNILVLFSFYAQPKLRRVKYYPIISLNFADLLCAVTAMPLYIIKKNVGSKGVDPRLVCDLYRFFYFFTQYASILSLAVISVERFLTIKSPLKFRNYIPRRIMTGLLVMCWCEACVVASMPFYWRNPRDTECTNSPTYKWSLMAISVNVFLPFFVMLVCHCYIYIKTLCEFGCMKNFDNNIREQRSMMQNSRSERVKKWRMEKKATISFTVVIGVFLICWGPSTIYYFLRNLRRSWFPPSFERYHGVFGATVKILTFCNSFMNPVIYFWLNLDFRQAFVRVLKREWESRSTSGATNSFGMYSECVGKQCMVINTKADECGQQQICLV